MAGQKSCIFCDIIAGRDSGKTEILMSDETLVIFRDIRPATPHHYLVVTREHLSDAKALRHEHVQLVEQMVTAGKELVQKQGGDTTDLRIGFHWPPFHTISHLHLHVISSTNQMGWIASGIFKPKSFWFVTVDWLLDRLKKMAPQNTGDVGKTSTE